MVGLPVAPGPATSWRGLAGTAYVGLWPLCFPQPLGAGVVDAGPVLGWIAPLALCAAVDGLSPGRAALRGLGLAWLAHAVVFHWIQIAAVRYGGASQLVGVAAPALLALYPAVFVAAFAAAVRWLAPRGALGAALWAGSLWTAADWLRSFALTGFPWAELGYAQLGNPWLPGLARVTGVYGLSFVSVAVAWALHAAASGRGPARRRALATAVAVAVAAHAAGGVLRGRALSESPRMLRVAAVQGNVTQDRKWRPEQLERALARYAALTRTAVAAGAEVVVWPETALPTILELDGARREALAALATETGAVLVVGAVGATPSRDRDGVTEVFDSAFVVRPGLGLSARYDKSHLVPFGEYVPLRPLLGRFVEAIARGAASDDVTAGPGPAAVPLRAATPEAPALRAGLPVCYELLFPDRVRRFVADGAPLLLAVTNDAWYGRSGAPHQFLAITAMRALETGVWVVRAANTGVSAVIDAAGRVRRATEIFEEAWVMADVPLHPRPAEATFYVRHGDVFAGACAGLAAAALLRKGLRARRRGPRAEPAEETEHE